MMKDWKVAKKTIVLLEQLKFLRLCKIHHVIPKGLHIENKLQNTFQSREAISLASKQSRQWLILCHKLTYGKLSLCQRNCVFPRNQSETNILQNMSFKKRNCLIRKFHSLLPKITNNNNRQNYELDSNNILSVLAFINKSSDQFNNREITLLNKGPAYVPPPSKLTSIDMIKVKGEIHGCYDRVMRIRNDTEEFRPSNIVNFLYNASRAVEGANKEFHLNRNEKIELNTLKEIKKKNVVICKSDKSNRLLALEKDDYSRQLRDSLGNIEECRQNKPISVQQKFNKNLMSVANKYPGDIRQLLTNAKCSDPLPKRPYGLPKDHKSGILKLRPIVSNIDSAAEKLSKLLVKVLTPLLDHIPAYIDSRESLLQNLPSSLRQDQYFGSLDVVNLYGSIPLRAADSIPSVFDIVTNFFNEHNEETIFCGMKSEDFKTLLELGLLSDTICLNAKTYMQQCGIPMGNNIAPTMAIIYMNHIEQQLISMCNGKIDFFRRYVDDIFFVAQRELQIESLLCNANSINRCIQFTCDLPNENYSMPFLDMLISYSPDLSTTLYTKPMHSKSILHATAYVPNQRKVNLIRTELQRAIKCSNSSHNKADSIKKIVQRFQKNGYKSSFINKNLNFINDNVRQSQRSDTVKEDPATYLKLPYQNEKTCQQIRRLARNAGIENKIRIIFQTPPSLYRQLAPKKELLECPASCITCKLGEKPLQCKQKAVIYLINCSICSFEYVGEAKRCAGSRIEEHTKRDSSFVFQHMKTKHPPYPLAWKWRILCKIRNWYARTAAESLIAQQRGLTQQTVRVINSTVFN